MCESVCCNITYYFHYFLKGYVKIFINSAIIPILSIVINKYAKNVSYILFTYSN